MKQLAAIFFASIFILSFVAAPPPAAAEERQPAGRSGERADAPTASETSGGGRLYEPSPRIEELAKKINAARTKDLPKPAGNGEAGEFGAKHIRAVDALLGNAGAETLPLYDLSMLYLKYTELFVEPCLDDDITRGMLRAVKKRVSGKALLVVNNGSIPMAKVAPFDAFAIRDFDRRTYIGQRLDAYADDSIHVPEFPENYDCRPLKIYCAGSTVSIELDEKFKALTPVCYYRCHTEEGPVSLRQGETFPAGLREAVFFIIITEKGCEKLMYKLLWVVNS